jgi:hypothetical protein
MEKHDYMDKEVASYLISEFERQYPFLHLDDAKRASLVEVLETTPMLESQRFYEEPSKDQKYTKRQIFNDTDRTGYLRITRIMRNNQAGNLQEGLIKKVQENILHKFGLYSSTMQLRHMRKEEKIVQMMLERAKTGEKLDQLSLLFRYEQTDVESLGETPQIINSDLPIIVIPRATKAEMEILRSYEEREGVVHAYTGEGRNERVKIMSYANYLRSIKNQQ